MSNRIFTTGEVAKYCGVDFRTVIRWIEKGHLQAYRLPARGDRRIKYEDLVSFMAESDIPLPPELQEKNNRILIISHNPDEYAQLAYQLEINNFSSEITSSFFKAGIITSTFRPSIIVIDISLHGDMAYETIKQLKTSEDLKKNIKIIAVCDSTDQKGKCAQTNAIMAKPFKNNELFDKIYRLTGTKFALENIS